MLVSRARAKSRCRIRTDDMLLTRQLLWPAELIGHFVCFPVRKKKFQAGIELSSLAYKASASPQCFRGKRPHYSMVRQKVNAPGSGCRF